MARGNLGGRFGLVALTALAALAFGWSALFLPGRPEPIGLLAWALAAANSCAALALLGWRARARRALGWLGALSLAAAPVFVWAMASTGLEMVERFGALGRGLAVALGAIGWLLVLGTLPVGLVALYYRRRLAPVHGASPRMPPETGLGDGGRLDAALAVLASDGTHDRA